ncbi:hypothetical protein D9M72_388510 [compost metagenome]
MADRGPVVLVRRQQDLAGGADFLRARPEGGDDRRDLARMDAPLAQVAELGARAQRVVARPLRCLHIGADVVRRHLAMAMAGSGDFQHGASDQRMLELLWRAHGIAGNCAMVRRDEVHQAEAQAFHLHQRGDVEGLFERRVCLDQHMDRDMAGDAGIARHLVDMVGHARDLDHVGHLGHDHVGQPGAGGAHQHVDILAPARVSGIMDAHADAVVRVQRTVDQLRAQLGVLALLADRGAVLAVEGDIEDRPKLLLQGKRLAHQLFAARVVVTHRQLDRDGFALEQDLGWMHGNSGGLGLDGRHIIAPRYEKNRGPAPIF